MGRSPFLVGSERRRLITKVVVVSVAWAVVVAQLVERSLLTPEACGTNPVIGKLLY